jgi:hypothetical protein
MAKISNRNTCAPATVIPAKSVSPVTCQCQVLRMLQNRFLRPTAVVGKILGADDINIADLQGGGQMDKHEDFERTPIEGHRFRPVFDGKALPALEGKSEIDLIQHDIAAKPAHE